MKGLVRFWHREDGQAMVESAITMPIFLFLLCGIIELSYMFVVKSCVDYAAYCAARAGITHNGDPERMKWAAAQALAPITQSAVLSKIPVPISLRTSNSGGLTGALAMHATHWGATLLARAQFEAKLPNNIHYGSWMEYAAEILSLDAQSAFFATKAMGATGKHIKSRSEAKKKNELKKDVFPINDMRILDPDDVPPPPTGNVQPPIAKTIYGDHPYLSIKEFWTDAVPPGPGLRAPSSYLLAREPRASELDKQKGNGAPYDWNRFLGEGLAFTDTRPDVVKKMRLRVEVIHSHKLLFKFLIPTVKFFPIVIVDPEPKYGKFWSTGINPGTKKKVEKMQDDLFRNIMGRVLIRGEYTMRMMSNFMEPPLPSKGHKGRDPQ